jgi:hypothetical protein
MRTSLGAPRWAQPLAGTNGLARRDMLPESDQKGPVSDAVHPPTYGLKCLGHHPCCGVIKRPIRRIQARSFLASPRARAAPLRIEFRFLTLSAPHRSAAMRPLSEENPTFGGQGPYQRRGEHRHCGGGAPPVGVRLVEHGAVVARAGMQVGRLDAKLDAAMSNGELQHFNREFRRRRIETAARRLPFPTYNRALAKLRAAWPAQEPARSRRAS